MSARSLARELRTDGRESVFQCIDVAGRVHRARGAHGRAGLDGAVDGAAAVGLPAAVLPGEPEVRRGRRGGARQRHPARDLRAHRRERVGQAHVRARRAGVAGGGAVPHAGVRRDARDACPLGAAGRDHLPLRQ